MLYNFVEIAKIGNTYGLYGELNLYPLANPIETILSYGAWYIKYPLSNIWRPLKGESVFKRSNKAYIKLFDINDIDSAKIYVNSMIGVPEGSLLKLSNNEVYFRNLLGCNVKNINKYSFGIVTDIIETKANKVLVCEKIIKYLIPYVKNYIISEDFNLRQIIVDWNYNY